jgi:N utilization substance protein B
MVSRRHEQRARARALQALYAADVRGIGSLSRVSQMVFDDLGVEARERTIAEALIASAVTHSAAIEASLVAATANWRMERLGAIERSVLRLGAAELAAGTTPARVVLQESVRLAERFGGVESARFVNGVLDAVARRMERL